MVIRDPFAVIDVIYYYIYYDEICLFFPYDGTNPVSIR